MNKIDVHQLTDFRGTLEELAAIVAELTAKHGGDSIIEFDAGPNNVWAYLEES